MADKAYDEALFKQLLTKRKRNNKVSLTDIHDVWCVVAWDLYLAIEQQKPEHFDDVEEYVMEVVVPDLAKALEREGWVIEEYAK